MTTITKDIKKGESEISSDALGVLDCFVSNLDEIVYEMAEKIAKNRAISAGPPPHVVRIEIGDVEEAAKNFFGALRDGLDRGDIPSDLKPIVDSMQKCFETRCMKK